MDLLQDRFDNFMAWMEANGLNANRVSLRSGVPYNTIKSYVDKGGTASLKGDNEARIAASYRLPVEAIFGGVPVEPEDREANHLAAWRAKAGLSQEQVAAALGTSLRVVEQLEDGEIDISAKWLRRLADVFGANAGQLLMAPEEAQSDLFEVARAVPKDQQNTAVRVLRSLTGTDG